MERKSLSPRQLLLIRQALIVVAIIILAYFAVNYARNVMRYRAKQDELAQMQGHIATAEQEKEQVDRQFDESLSPAVVEEFARKELNWVRPGDEVVIPVGKDVAAPDNSDPTTPPETESPPEIKPNWQLWLELLAGE